MNKIITNWLFINNIITLFYIIEFKKHLQFFYSELDFVLL